MNATHQINSGLILSTAFATLSLAIVTMGVLAHYHISFQSLTSLQKIILWSAGSGVFIVSLALIYCRSKKPVALDGKDIEIGWLQNPHEKIPALKFGKLFHRFHIFTREQYNSFSFSNAKWTLYTLDSDPKVENLQIWYNKGHIVDEPLDLSNPEHVAFLADQSSL